MLRGLRKQLKRWALVLLAVWGLATLALNALIAPDQSPVDLQHEAPTTDQIAFGQRPDPVRQPASTPSSKKSKNRKAGDKKPEKPKQPDAKPPKGGKGEEGEEEDSGEEEEIAALLQRSRSPADAYLNLLPFAELDHLFVSQSNHRRIRSRQPMTPRLVDKVLPAVSPSTHYDTCAIVGNSGVLKRAGHGPAIDRHDAVMRVNQAPTAGYEGMVGSRTTFRLLNNKWTTVYYEDGVADTNVPGGTSNLARYLMKAELPNSTLVVARAASATFEQLAVTAMRRRPDVRVLYLSSRVMSQARQLLHVFERGHPANDTRPAGTPTTPSTGFIGIYLLLQMCSHVTVYGLSLQESRHASEMKEAGTSYHYFKRWADSEQLRAHPHHSFSMEGDALQDLHARRLIRLCSARPPPGTQCGWPAELEEEGEGGREVQEEPPAGGEAQELLEGVHVAEEPDPESSREDGQDGTATDAELAEEPSVEGEATSAEGEGSGDTDAWAQQEA